MRHGKTGWKHTEATKQMMSQVRKGKQLPRALYEANIDAIRKPVMVVDAETGELVDGFISRDHACESLGVSHYKLSKWMKNKMNINGRVYMDGASTL